MYTSILLELGSIFQQIHLMMVLIILLLEKDNMLNCGGMYDGFLKPLQ